MLTFDRYLLRLFTKVLVVCFISITGLYIVVDAFTNLDEFMGYGRQEGSVLAVLSEYYSAQLPWFFDRISGVLTLIAAVFAVTWLQRTRELTALLAAGIPQHRIIRPLIAAAVAVSLIAAANRELTIPALRGKLMRNAQDWRGERPKRVEPVRDNQTDILINGRYTYANERRIEMPDFLLDRPLGGFGRRLLAANAYYREPENGRPRGYLLTEVQVPENLAEVSSVVIDGRPLILAPKDTPWLQPNQCFVASEVGFEQLEGGELWRRLSSTPQLLAGLRNPSLDFGLDAKVTVHARLVQPFLDIVLLFLGLPLVLTRENRNLFLAGGWCLGLVLLFVLFVTGCQLLGSKGYLLSPSLAAWLPLLVFVPAATALAHPIFE